VSHTRWMHTMGLCGLLSLSLPAHAGRPLATDDAGTLEPGDCELESYAGHGRANDAPSSQRLSAQLGCGALKGTQVALAAVRDRSDGQQVQTLNLTGKTRLHQAADDGPSFALAYGLSWQRTTGSALRHECGLLNGIMSWPVSDDLTLHANLGWSHNQSVRADTTNWSVAIEHGVGHGIDLMAEILDDDRSHQPWLQTGMRWAAVPDKLFLDASLGAQSGSRHARAVTLGLRYAF
jgi:hypothetical protein